MKEITLDVSGMSCEGCASAVRKALERLEGVRRADVSLEEGTARVLADDPVGDDALVEGVEAAGYGASVRS